MPQPTNVGFVKNPPMRILLSILPLLAFCAGCASPYWQNRRADAADVFTATVGLGYGATARIGPFHTGLGANFDFYGMEAGEVGELSEFYSIIKGGGWIAEDHSFLLQGDSGICLGPRCEARGKAIAYRSSNWSFWNPPPPESPNPARWTQMEVAAGLVGGIRLGFNPGEVLDFIVGFLGLDLYGDDLEGLPDDWETLAKCRRVEGEARRVAANRRRLRFDKWSGKDTPALRDWRGWVPDLTAPGRTVTKTDHAGQLVRMDGETRMESGWRLSQPYPPHPNWTNSWSVVVHGFATPTEARERLFCLLDESSRLAKPYRRTGPDAPGDVCFIHPSKDGKIQSVRFARDGVVVSIVEFSYGPESDVLALARSLDAQILATLKSNEK